MSLPEWRVFADAQTLVTQLADALCEVAEDAIRARDTFHLVLAGGRTPQALYRELAKRHAGDAHWHIWYGDERCLPADYYERNSVMNESAWLAESSIPSKNRCPIPAEHGATEAATRYASVLKDVADFDVVLLGIGEDGHTASLFPGHDWGNVPASPDVLAVLEAPKPPFERVSLSAARLSRSECVWFLVSGSDKREALALWKNGVALPVSAIRGKQQTVVWLDQAARPEDK